MSTPVPGFEPKLEELLISLIADMVAKDRHIAVGTASPIPGSAALLAQSEANHRMDVTVIQSLRNNTFTDGGRELFDCAGQGRIDTFFLGGVQIDGAANVNLIGVGDYPNLDKRFPGSFGSAFMYFVIPKVILFREEHTPRTLVEKVDFISAPGTSPENVYRPGGPRALVTSKCVFAFDKSSGRFSLQSVHPGVTVEEVRAATGFTFDEPARIEATPCPSPERLERIRQQIAPSVAQFYPEFAARVWPRVG